MESGLELISRAFRVIFWLVIEYVLPEFMLARLNHLSNRTQWLLALWFAIIATPLLALGAILCFSFAYIAGGAEPDWEVRILLVVGGVVCLGSSPLPVFIAKRAKQRTN